MNRQDKRIDNLLRDLQERAKELNCLYKVEEILSDTNATVDELFQRIVEILPSGWKHPEVCRAKITYENNVYQSPGFKDTERMQHADIIVQGKKVGKLSIVYIADVPTTDGQFFLREENKLIKTIAERISQTLLHKSLKSMFREWEEINQNLSMEAGKSQVIIDTLRRTDKKLFTYISRKMIHYLSLKGVEEANLLLKKLDVSTKIVHQEFLDDINRPSQRQSIDYILELSDDIFRIASGHLSEDQILSNIEKWMAEDKSRFLVRAIDNPSSSLNAIIDAIARYQDIENEGIKLSPSIEKGLRVSLIRRFFSEQLEFINIAKNFIDVSDYYKIIHKIIFPVESHGKLGGKSSGLFLATQILSKPKEYAGCFKDIKIPTTWYIASDGLISFVHYNNLEEIIEQKYKDIEEIRLEYPNIVQIFKNSHFPPKILNGLSLVIEDIGDRPIIVRSSSLLEDRFGATFSGKYKSLFLANQGTKEERLEALTDAIAEVYASTFSPDPIEYRTERGLLDFFEEMGIMIQEVVGAKVGDYFLPAFAGVAFSNNEFRWSSRINREDGLIRMVPGLGTRAVDRLSDDYPTLISPGKPDLRANVTPEEIFHYSTKKIDVINVKDNTFETIEISELLKKFGDEFPAVHQIVSIYADDTIKTPSSSFGIDFDRDNLLVTFEGLTKRTPFIKQIRTLLSALQGKIEAPVDIEFAHDGKDFYLLQCRPQSATREALPSTIPKDIRNEDVLFSAKKYVSNGFVPDITHIVYVNPDAYNRLQNLSELSQIGRAIGRLNNLLPKRQFILMGPGRWGSRGDIKLGVNVTYSEINNTAMLIEIAKKKGNYTPELSFGTHFFQDLVESSIRYLPLYPDDEGIVFNEPFLLKSKNILPKLSPDLAPLADVVRVIDVPKTTHGSILRVLMNANLNQALGFFTRPTRKP